MDIPEPTTTASAVARAGGSWFHAAEWSAADLLPGLYLAALFVLFHALLRRRFDPVPLRVRLLFALILLVLFGPALFGGRVLLPLENLRAGPPFTALEPSRPGGWGLQVDLTHEIAPHQVQVRRQLGRGEWPLWNDLVGAGMPLLADPQSQALQPLVLLGLPFPVPAAAGVSAALRVLVALSFFYLLLRRQGLSESAALFGCISYALSGCAMLWLGWPLANAVVLLPAVLYAVTRAIECGGVRDRVLLFATLVALFWSGHPETALYAFSLALVFTISKVWARRGTGTVAAVLARLAAVAAIAAGTAAPMLLPAQQYLPTTERAAVLRAVFGGPIAAALREVGTPEWLDTWRRRGLQRASTLVAARPFGDQERYRGETNLIDDSAGFAGTLGLLLALATLRSPRAYAQERCMRWVLAGSVLLLLQPPGLDVLTYHLPVIDFTAAHKHRRILMLVAFAVAYLGACGVDRWRRGALPPRRVLVSGLLLAAAIGLAYVGNVVLSGHGLVSGFQATAVAAQAIALLAAIATLLARPRFRTAAVLVAVAAVELLLIHLPANLPNSPGLAYPPTPALQFLQAQLGDYRLSGIGPALAPNTASAYGLADIRIRNPAAPAAYAAVVAGLQLAATPPALGKPRHTLYDFLGVRYVVARPNAALPLRLAYRGPDAAIFERPAALRRMFLPDRAEAVDGSGWQAALDPDFAFARRALFHASPDHPNDWRAAARRSPRLRVRVLGATRSQAGLNLAEERLLVSNQFQDGSWYFLVDGRSHPGIEANGPFAAAWIPQGRHVVDLLYRSKAHCWGLLLAAAAIAAGLAWSISPPSPAPPSTPTPLRT